MKTTQMNELSGGGQYTILYYYYCHMEGGTKT